MKEVTLKISDNKFQFFMELIRNLDFVQVDTSEDSKKDILKNIKTGLNEVKLSREGKLETTSANDFLNDL